MKKVLAFALSLCMLLSGVAMAESDGATYTYDIATAVFPTTWNPHQYKTNDDFKLMMTYLTDDLYAFDYNDDETGYAMRNHMSVGEPVDVTADYVGEEWGIEAGAEGRAWKYTLRDDLKWNDGTPINAQTFVESVKRQLNPKAQNYRADSLYAGSTVLHNAENYVKQGTTAQISLNAFAANNGLADVSAVLEQFGDQKGYINWKSSYGATYNFDTKVWDEANVEDAVVETPLTVKELYDFFTTGEGAKHCDWADEAQKLAWAPDELFTDYTFPELDFAKVGIQAASELEVVFVLDKPLSGFQLKYNLSVPLVHTELYDKCETVKDGVYTNTYGTTADTTASYGPYMLKSFQSDKEFVLEKNPYWYGYSLPENEGTYQTTHIKTTFVSEDATSMEMFLNGQLDEKGLSKDYLVDYATSDYTYYSEGPSVFGMAVNPHLENLTKNQAAAGENINKTILTLKDFRMALSLGMDRAAFIAATSPAGVPAFALYGNTIVGDPETATFYRDTEEAKQVIVDFWGLTDEIGTTYADLDEAIGSITGYNPEMAKEYFNKAYDEAIEQKLMDEDDVVEIVIGLPATTPTYTNGFEFIQNNFVDLVKGTKLEGKLTFKKDDTVGNAFGDALRSNQVDMLFYVGWSGSEFDPYNLIGAYVESAYQYDPAVDYTTVEVPVVLDDVTYVASAYDWYQCVSGTEIQAVNEATKDKVAMALPYSDDPQISGNRLKVLAALEGAVLQNYDFIPLSADARATLKGMQIEYHTEEEVFPMGYGGLKYFTYNYTDAEWNEFVASQGGTLEYK